MAKKKSKVVYDPTKDNSRKAEKKKPSKPAATQKKKPNEELAPKILEVMQKLTENGVVEATSTDLRDKLKLDKESGRDIVRRVMKKLEADGKVEIGKKAFKGKRKRYVYKLKKNK